MIKIREKKFGNILAVEETAGHIPLDCPVCLLTLRDAADANAFRTHMCCTECKMHWAEPNGQQWLQGWRPNQEQLNNYRLKLNTQPTYLLSQNS